MTTTYDMHIEQIVQSIFSTMLGMDIVRGESAEIEGEDTLLGTIQIAGAKSMSVVLRVSEGVARAATVAMLQIPAADVSDEDKRDVVAELANMIGGNLKGLLPGPLYLSLPTVVGGCNVGLQVPGAEMVDEVSLHCEPGSLRVSLYQKLTA